MSELSVLHAAAASAAPIHGSAVLEAGRAIEPGWHVVERGDGIRVRIDFAAEATQQQKDDADDAVLAADLSAGGLAASATAGLRSGAKALLDDSVGASEKLARAIALVTMDEINHLRQWLTSFKAQVAAATSLADLKTRVAGLPNVPDRTANQAMTAVRDRIDTTDAN